VWIITAKQCFLATQPLSRIEQKLPASQFQRVHRSALVNVNYIRELHS
jgi:two-component system LytT family response regulator